MPIDSVRTDAIKIEVFRKYGIHLVYVYFFRTFEGNSRIPIYEFIMPDGSFCIRIFARYNDPEKHFAYATMTDKYKLLSKLEA